MERSDHEQTTNNPQGQGERQGPPHGEAHHAHGEGMNRQRYEIGTIREINRDQERGFYTEAEARKFAATLDHWAAPMLFVRYAVWTVAYYACQPTDAQERWRIHILTEMAAYGKPDVYGSHISEPRPIDLNRVRQVAIPALADAGDPSSLFGEVE